MLKLYTKTVCPKCMSTKNQLNALGIEFEAINLNDAENEHHAERLRENNLMTAPVLEIDGALYGNHDEITEIINGLAE